MEKLVVVHRKCNVHLFVETSTEQLQKKSRGISGDDDSMLLIGAFHLAQMNIDHLFFISFFLSTILF